MIQFILDDVNTSVSRSTPVSVTVLIFNGEVIKKFCKIRGRRGVARCVALK